MDKKDQRDEVEETTESTAEPEPGSEGELDDDDLEGVAGGWSGSEPEGEG